MGWTTSVYCDCADAVYQQLPRSLVSATADDISWLSMLCEATALCNVSQLSAALPTLPSLLDKTVQNMPSDLHDVTDINTFIRELRVHLRTTFFIKMCSCIDLQSHASNNLITLTFDPLTSRSMYAECLPWTICLLSLVLIAQAIFLLQCRQTYSQTQLTTLHTSQLSATAGLHKYYCMVLQNSWMLYLVAPYKFHFESKTEQLTNQQKQNTILTGYTFGVILQVSSKDLQLSQSHVHGPGSTTVV